MLTKSNLSEGEKQFFEKFIEGTVGRSKQRNTTGEFHDIVILQVINQPQGIRKTAIILEKRVDVITQPIGFAIVIVIRIFAGTEKRS